MIPTIDAESPQWKVAAQRFNKAVVVAASSIIVALVVYLGNSFNSAVKDLTTDVARLNIRIEVVGAQVVGLKEASQALAAKVEKGTDDRIRKAEALEMLRVRDSRIRWLEDEVRSIESRLDAKNGDR